VWPISMLLMADMVFCVADMVVADIVCGRYRRFPITSDAPGAVKLRGQDTTGQNAAENPEI